MARSIARSHSGRAIPTSTLTTTAVTTSPM
ncbi:hypothetical protein EDD41_1741 [Luteococcus japonicus]|uniref:Uncharacterized protein n=1 Tax=Luteococcus japonicus TaxID=33984 RepID=A0A3N1ZUH7_9ACTN|nr:hypothetical protein EDD41_1741 [Luteococcus japonicus]